MKRAQAMFETLIAVLVIMLIFTGAFRISRMLAARTVLDYAAARAARAKAVGFNDFMCVKSARAAMIPVAGKRLWQEVTRRPPCPLCPFCCPCWHLLPHQNVTDGRQG